MSNIYILETPTKDGGREYRVSQFEISNLQVIEKLCWVSTDDSKIHIQKAREMWPETSFSSLEEAEQYSELFDGYAESGIGYFSFEEVF